MVLAFGALTNAPRFGGKIERQAFGNALAVELDQPGGFTPHPGPAISPPFAGILDHDLAGPIFGDESLANQSGMAQLDELAAALQTDAVRRSARSIAHFPLAAIQLIEHSQRWPAAKGRRGHGNECSHYPFDQPWPDCSQIPASLQQHRRTLARPVAILLVAPRQAAAKCAYLSVS